MKILSMAAARELKKAKLEDPDYEYKVKLMGKVELLDEMVTFQEERSRIGHLTPAMMVRGKILFKALEEHAETHALRVLTKSYRRHLEYELADYLDAQKPAHEKNTKPAT